MRIVSVAGIPIRLHWSFVLIVGVYAVWMRATHGAVAFAAIAGVATTLFTTVILHELGHALVARRFGIRTAHITLYPFGGIAAIERMPESPREEFLIAIAGPAVNVALAGMFGLFWALTGWLPLSVIVAVNVVMAVFNLIPAFPMDGGRVLRSLLAGPLGFVRASRVAITVGRGFAWVFLGTGLVLMNPSLVFVSLFLHYAVSVERRRLGYLEHQEHIREVLRASGWGARGRYEPRWRLRPRTADL